MKICINCGNSIGDDVVFCPFCASKQKVSKSKKSTPVEEKVIEPETVSLEEKPKKKKKKKKKPNKTVINPKDFDNTIPISIDKGQNVFSEKPEVKEQRIFNEKKRIEEEKNQTKEELEEAEKKKRELEEENERYKHIALHDELTGLKNRTAFEKDIKELKSKDLCCISVDANNLKKVNDNIGHKYGDILLKTIADALKEVFGDNVYRLGGDEFEVLLVGEGEVAVKHKINAVKKLLEEQEKEIDEEFEISAAIGVSFSNGTNTINEMLEEADHKMYEDKKSYKENQLKESKYEPNYDGYYNDVKAEYEEAVKDNKTDLIKTIIKVGVIAVVAITVWVVIFAVI